MQDPATPEPMIKAPDLLIRAERVGLEIPSVSQTRAGSQVSWRSFIGGFGRRRNIHLERILHDVNFELRPGDRLGLVGRNGSGKTTLLKVLAGIYPATIGALDVRGRVQSLINISAGMHNEATGFENILLRGLHLDFPLNHMREKADDIIAFAELENSIYKPLYTYSAGMRARLALSIVLALEPEILLLDEWLGRGDPEFQDKASERLKSFMESAGIVVLASHNERLINRTCNRVIELRDGTPIRDEPIDPAALNKSFIFQRRIKAKKKDEGIKERAKAEAIREKRKQEIIREKRKEQIIREKRKKELIREKRATKDDTPGGEN